MNKIRIAVVLVFLLVMGVVLTVSGVRDIIRINGYVPDFNFDSMADIKKGGFVQGYVENIFDCYASETTTETTMGIETSSRTSEEYFLMPLINEADVDNELYVTISASNINDRKLLYAVCDDTWEYLDGNTDIDFTEMYIVARVKKMDSDLMPLLTDWFTSSGIYDSAAETSYSPLSVPYQTANNPQASGNSFSESGRPAAVPVHDIPQPVQPDEFFARPERKSAPAAEKELSKPEPKTREETPAFIPGNMDDLDTSALNTDDLAYYETPADSEDYSEYDFSNDGDFADAVADSIQLD